MVGSRAIVSIIVCCTLGHGRLICVDDCSKCLFTMFSNEIKTVRYVLPIRTLMSSTFKVVQQVGTLLRCKAGGNHQKSLYMTCVKTSKSR